MTPEYTEVVNSNVIANLYKRTGFQTNTKEHVLPLCAQGAAHSRGHRSVQVDSLRVQSSRGIRPISKREPTRRDENQIPLVQANVSGMQRKYLVVMETRVHLSKQIRPEWK